MLKFKFEVTVDKYKTSLSCYMILKRKFSSESFPLKEM